MMNKYFSFLCIIILFLSCKEDETSLIPLVETGDAIVPVSGGVTITGNILDIGKEKVTSFGFELSANGSNFSYFRRHLVNSEIETGKFELQINQGLYAGEDYYYTAFVETSFDTYKGERLSFKSRGSANVTLEKATPNLTHINDTVALFGKNFSKDVQDIELKFGNSYAKILSSSGTVIEFIVPKPDNNKFNLELKSYGKVFTNNNLLKLHTPVINSLSPNRIFFLDTITIYGKHFNKNIFFTNVHIGGIRATIVETYRDSLKVIVPDDIGYLNTQIKLYAQSQYTYFNNFSLYEPKFLKLPREIYMGKEYGVEIDKNFSYKHTNFSFEGKRVGFFTSLDKPRMVVYSNVYDNRENYLVWKITNDKVIRSDHKLKIINPFLLISNSFDNRPLFKEITLAYSDNNAFVLGLDNKIDGLFLFTYDGNKNDWIRKNKITTSNEFNISVYTKKIIFSKYDNKIYGTTKSGNGGNFFELDTQTSIVKELPRLPETIGKGFSYKNSIYVISGKYLNELWKYNIDNRTWGKFIDLPIEDNSFFERAQNVCVNIIGDYAYFNNGVAGNQYSDFWRLNLQNSIWEKLKKNPNPVLKATSYSFKNELHYISNKSYKYNIDNNEWQEIEYPGLNIAQDYRPVFSFKQNSIPYVLEVIRGNFSDGIQFYKGDFVK